MRFKQLYEQNYKYPRWVTINGKHIHLDDQYSFDFDKFIGKKQTDKEKHIISKEEKESIYNYTGADFEFMNKALRGISKSEMDEKTKKDIKNIDNFLNKNPLKKDSELFQNLKLFRRTKNPIVEEAFKNGDLKPGFEFTEKAYSSSSRSEKQALNAAYSSQKEKDNMVFVINAKKGQKAADISDYSEFGKEESEVLIGRNTKFKVSKIKKIKKKFKLPNTPLFKGKIVEEEFSYIYMDIVSQD